MSLKQEETVEIKGVGIDITPVYKIARLISRNDCETLKLLFTASEINLCQSASNPYQSYAVCFATKEAVGKALGTGLVGIDWNEIEANIIYNKLTVDLHGKAIIQEKKRGIRKWLATWSYWDQHVLVHVLAL